MTHSDHLLRQILTRIEELHQQGKACLAAFDLDSTLFDVSPRVQKILEEFAADPHQQNKFPQQIRKLKGIRTCRSDWGFADALARAGLNEEHPDFVEAVRDYWKPRFFSNEYLQYDEPYEGAADFVNTVHKLGADVVYLTGRDVHRMGKSTGPVLQRWGFPLGDSRARLTLKPDKELDDAEFKTEWFQKLPRHRYQEIWFFENEPVNIHHLRRHLPEIKIIFFKSTHAGKATEPEDLPRILHFLLGETRRI